MLEYEEPPIKIDKQHSVSSIKPYVREYAMTILGEPICLNEYAAQIVAQTTRTHVILTEDYNFWMGRVLKKEHINLESGIDELMASEYIGRDRLHYGFNVKSVSLYEYFKKARKRNRHVFQFPYHLKLAGAAIKNFTEVVENRDGGSIDSEQITIDLRTEKQLEENKTRQKINTLKQDLDIWNERPMLIREIEG